MKCRICGREFEPKTCRNVLCGDPRCKQENKNRDTRARYWARKGTKPKRTTPIQRKQGWMVVHDPSGDFPRGRILMAVPETLHDGNFEPGMILERNGVHKRVKGVIGKKQRLVRC